MVHPDFADYDDTVEQDPECIHFGVECEYNTDEDGNAECPCRCSDCGYFEDDGFNDEDDTTYYERHHFEPVCMLPACGCTGKAHP